VSLLGLLLVACGTAPSAPPPTGTPRTTQAAVARLEALGVDRPVCEGGALGDEVSLACRGTWDGHATTLDAVTTGAPLPETAGAVGAMVEDLWVEVRVDRRGEPDRALAHRLLRRYAAAEGAP
jgi:hypothetical protein